MQTGQGDVWAFNTNSCNMYSSTAFIRIIEGRRKVALTTKKVGIMFRSVQSSFLDWVWHILLLSRAISILTDYHYNFWNKMLEHSIQSLLLPLNAWTNDNAIHQLSWDFLTITTKKGKRVYAIWFWGAEMRLNMMGNIGKWHFFRPSRAYNTKRNKVLKMHNSA